MRAVLIGGSEHSLGEMVQDAKTLGTLLDEFIASTEAQLARQIAIREKLCTEGVRGMTRAELLEILQPGRNL